jgi:RNA polymerase sigma factor (sigma-70 family)
MTQMTGKRIIALKGPIEERTDFVCGIAAGGSTKASSVSDHCSLGHLTTLAQEAARGNRKALEELLNHKEFQQQLKDVCQWLYRRFTMTGDYCDWQDLQQEVNRIILTRIEQFKNEASIITYVSRIARNIYFSHLRRERLKNGYIGRHHPVPPEEVANDVELGVLLQEAVSNLSDQQRYVLRRKLEGATLKELAQELDCSITTVHSTLQRAQKQLVKCVQDEKRKMRGKSQLCLPESK